MLEAIHPEISNPEIDIQLPCLVLSSETSYNGHWGEPGPRRALQSALALYSASFGKFGQFGLAFGKYDVTCEHGDEHTSEMVTLIREQALIIS